MVNSNLRKMQKPGLRFDDLRHTAATRMIEAGTSIVGLVNFLVTVI